MATFEVAVPIIRGFQVFTVEGTKSAAEATSMVIEGDIDPISEFDELELDFDTNTWDIQEV